MAKSYANSCKEKYDFAVSACAPLSNSCNEALICKNLRTKCNQNVNDYASCQDFAACAGENTPKIYPSTCRYNWVGHIKNGKCENSNVLAEKVIVACPGNFIALSRYNDPDFNCQSQVRKYKDQKLHCEEAIQLYFRNCPSDINRPYIAVKSCPNGEEPLPTVTETVSEDGKSVNVGRKFSELAAGAKWPADSLTRGAPASIAIGQ